MKCTQGPSPGQVTCMPAHDSFSLVNSWLLFHVLEQTATPNASSNILLFGNQFALHILLCCCVFALSTRKRKSATLAKSPHHPNKIHPNWIPLPLYSRLVSMAAGDVKVQMTDEEMLGRFCLLSKELIV